MHLQGLQTSNSPETFIYLLVKDNPFVLKLLYGIHAVILKSRLQFLAQGLAQNKSSITNTYCPHQSLHVVCPFPCSQTFSLLSSHHSRSECQIGRFTEETVGQPKCSVPFLQRDGSTKSTMLVFCILTQETISKFKPNSHLLLPH